jgi:hypothetical protein
MRTLKERREYYRSIEGTMTQEEIMRNMPDDELRYNALRKHGVDAIAELERRETKKANHIIPQPNIDIGV